MGKNEIKLRRQILSTNDIGRYRNYAALVKKHERVRRFRRSVRFFTYSLLITVIVLLFLIIISYMMVRLEKNRELKNKNEKGKITLVGNR